MIEKQLQYQTHKKEDLGYHNVPPPFNDNYTPSLNSYEDDDTAQYVESSNTVFVKSDECSSSKSEHVNATNASTSHADEVLVGDGSKKDSDDLVSSVDRDENVLNLKSNTSAAKTFHSRKIEKQPVNFVKPYDKCSCACENSKQKNQTESKTKNKAKTKNRTMSPSGPGQCHDNFPLKRQTCFNCGIAGHIARNCPYHVDIPYHGQGLLDVIKGRSLMRNPSNSRSQNSDWNANKANDKRPRTKWTRLPLWPRNKGPRTKRSGHLILEMLLPNLLG